MSLFEVIVAFSLTFLPEILLQGGRERIRSLFKTSKGSSPRSLATSDVGEGGEGSF